MEEKEITNLEGNIQVDETTYTSQYKCPNCDELFDGHECENCHYTENR